LRGEFRTSAGEERAAAETIGTVLVFAFVVTTASLLFVAGSEAIDRSREQATTESGEILTQEVDARVGSVAGASGTAATVVDLGDRNGGAVSLRRNGHLDVVVNGGACSARLGLPSVTVREGSGEGEVAYQAGGVWRRSANGSQAMVAPPDVTVQNGSLSVTTVNLTGRIGGDRFRIHKNVSASQARTEAVRQALTAGDCRRPDAVTVSVTSEYSGAWRSYLAAETNVTVSRTGPRTVAFTLTSAELPRSVDDSRNRVVDLTDGTMVTPDPSDGVFPGDSLTIDKSVGNRYLVSAEPVANGTTVSDIQEFDGGTVLRRPVDVAVVMDESGSMNSQGKIGDARAAAKQFVGLVNESRDRVALVGYTTEARYVMVEGERYFASDGATLNDTIDRYTAGGGTTINRGLNASLDVHDVESNASRERHVILLTDGKNSPGGGVCSNAGYPNSGAACKGGFDQRTLDAAHVAAEQDVVVHTIAFGNNADEDLLKDVKDITGGTYSEADTGAELRAVFRAIFEQITESEQIVKRPAATQLTIDGTAYKPEAVGDADGLASHDGYLNTNDPSFDGTVAYATRTSDDATMTVSAVELACAEYELTAVDHRNATTDETFNEVRCANATGVDRTLPPSNVTIYADGADVSDLRDVPNRWWQPDLYNDTLGPYRDGTDLDLPSNEALVVYEYGADGSNWLVVRYEFGLPESTRTAFVVDASITEASVDG
jgi:Mg-chelatase subunit ChlD